MVKTTVQIDGMSCSMCESHLNDTIRKNFSVKKVTSDHRKNKTEIIADNEITLSELQKVITPTGYKVISAESEPYKKKGLFSFGKN